MRQSIEINKYEEERSTGRNVILNAERGQVRPWAQLPELRASVQECLQRRPERPLDRRLPRLGCVFAVNLPDTEFTPLEKG